ncbi:LysR substrate-binding domain-containing protein [Tabrizicola oligotrophica]|uniref:LysR family transcriptional regulator n=1 Tax=Tabrizicola oligotrophica TaxID=2710650 RepID=A0A6M0QSJ3_9RHOB|nr:LysR substrate-binding domain-containing protein [Tabrizicola oligotrophica]NEY89961.1 LysR family transcriptional regulator [Tabrizicola oligotrophica]
MHNHTGIHPGLKLRHIRAVLDIAATGSLSQVARAQGITQPALSRTLAEAEMLLGVPLFRRESRRMVLTEQGGRFRQHASLALQALETAAASLHPGAGQGRLTVGVLPTAATRLFPRIALRLRDLAPEVLLSVITGPHSYLTGLLRDGTIDLMLGRLPGAREVAGLAFEHLYDEEIVLVARSGHPLIGDTRAALAACPLILPPEGAIIRGAVDDYLVSLGLGLVRPAIEAVALPLARGVLLGSDALWFISRGVVAEDLDRGDLAVLPTDARYLAGAVGITRRQAGATSPALDLLMQLAREGAQAGLYR